LRTVVARRPAAGVERALLALFVGARYSDGVLREELTRAYGDAGQGREKSLVRGVFFHTHRHYQRAADHLLAHFARYPADPPALLLISAFDLTGNLSYRHQGHQLVEQQSAVAGPDSWPWVSWLAATRAEQGRVGEALELAEQALQLYPRSAVAAHARAHAVHELGAGPAAVAWLDEWMGPDPLLPQRPHLHWHAALQSLAAGDLDDARRRINLELATTDIGMRSAVNWRLLLIGAAPADVVAAEQTKQLLGEPGGMVEVFHTFQLALALAVAGDHDGLTDLAHTAATDPRADYAEVLAPVATALAHLLAGRPAAAVTLLTNLGQHTERLGGVRVEREIIQDTLARALVNAGEPDRAAHLLQHRIHTRHYHNYEHQLLAVLPTSGQVHQGEPAPSAQWRGWLASPDDGAATNGTGISGGIEHHQSGVVVASEKFWSDMSVSCGDGVAASGL
jgi:predicted Zn-dependent protease